MVHEYALQTGSDGTDDGWGGGNVVNTSFSLHMPKVTNRPSYLLSQQLMRLLTYSIANINLNINKQQVLVVI